MFRLPNEAIGALREALAAGRDQRERQQQQALAQAQRVPLIAIGTPTSEDAYTAVSVVDKTLRFTAPEVTGVPVPFRSSIVRLALFKLIGSGVLAALTAAGSSEPFSRKSCAFAAAVNAVAVCHYFLSPHAV